MKYLGGKARIAKRICELLPAGESVWEPFVGGFNMTPHLLKKYNRVVSSDVHGAVASLGLAVSEGWQPPLEVSEAEYKAAKSLPDTDPLKGFVGFGCSFSGKYFGGYARDKTGFNYAKAASNSLQPLRGTSDRWKVQHLSFLNVEPLAEIAPSVIYCDPPYEGTTKYATDAFDHAKFWQLCTQWAALGSRVFVSEYSKPPVPHFLVWEHTGKQSMPGRKERTERLFEVFPCT